MSTLYTCGDVSNVRKVLLVGHPNFPKFNPRNVRMDEWEGKNIDVMMMDYCEVWNPSTEQQNEHLLYLWTTYIKSNTNIQCALLTYNGVAGESGRWPHVTMIWNVRTAILEDQAAEHDKQQLKIKQSQELEWKRSMMFRRVLVTGIVGHLAVIPKSQHGGIPHLDKYIKLNKKNDPRYRWKVDECYFCDNLTKARHQAALLHGLPIPNDLSTVVHFNSVTTPHLRRCRLPTKQVSVV